MCDDVDKNIPTISAIFVVDEQLYVFSSMQLSVQ